MTFKRGFCSVSMEVHKSERIVELQVTDLKGDPYGAKRPHFACLLTEKELRELAIMAQKAADQLAASPDNRRKAAEVRAEVDRIFRDASRPGGTVAGVGSF
jgi:hypothetical protein